MVNEMCLETVIEPIYGLKDQGRERERIILLFHPREGSIFYIPPVKKSKLTKNKDKVY